MTNHLARSSRIVGLPTTMLKAAMASWSRSGKGVEELAALRAISVTPGVAAAMIGEAWIRGLMDFVDEHWVCAEQGGFGLTREGMALATAQRRGRTRKHLASAVVDEMLSRAQALMHDKLAPRKVDKIWLFGSFIDPDKEDVGDIDLVVEDYRTGVVDYDQSHQYILENYPGLLRGIDDFYRRLAADELFLTKTLFGPRRHPLLAPNDLRTLIDLHRPCALVFDRAQGGIIAPRHFAHHPDSKRRAETIHDRLELPDLDRHDEVFRLTPPAVVDRSFRPGARPAAFDHLKWAPSNGNDVSDSFLLVGWQGARVALERRVDFDERTWTVTTTVRSLDDGDSFQWNDLAARLTWLVHADLIRLAEYRNQRRAMQEIISNIDFPSAPHDPLEWEIMRRLDWTIDGWDGRRGLPDSHSFGLEINCDDIPGPSRLAPHDFDDLEWEQMEKSLPFTRSEYMEWAAPLYGNLP